jgi:hypothetical protein
MTVAVGCLLAFAYVAWLTSWPADYSKLGPLPLHKRHTVTLACVNFTATWCDETWQSWSTFMDEMTRKNEATLRHRIVQDRVDGMLVDQVWHVPDSHPTKVMTMPPTVSVTVVWDD